MQSEINTYNIYEFLINNGTMNFEKSTIYSEKDLLNMSEETDYVINNLLKKERVEKKIATELGYVGTVTKINGEYRKTANETNLEKLKRISAN